MTQVKARLPVALVAASLVAGCAGSPVVEPLSLGDPALWTQQQAGLSSVAGAVIRDGHVVVAGDAGTSDRLVVLDAESGRTRWSLDQNQEIFGGDGKLVFGEATAPAFAGGNGKPVISGEGKDWKIIVPYWQERDDEVEVGVAALAGDSGAMSWSKPMDTVSDKYASEDVPPLPFAATSEAIVMRPWGTEVDLDAPVTALDPAGGKRLWQRTLEGWPYLVDGDTLLGDEADGFSEGEPGNDDDEAPTTAMAWDVRTGKPVWDLGEKYHSSSVKAVADGVAVIGVADSGAAWDKNLAVDVSTGEAIAELGDGYECETDGRSAIVCLGYDRMYTLTTADREVTEVVQPEVDGHTFDIVGVYRDQVFVTAGVSGEPAEVYVIDADNNLLAKDVPGRPEAIAGGRAVFITGEDTGANIGAELYGVTA